MLWFLGFIFIFTTGGMTGVLMSVPAADFQVHNSLFLIAHFHSMVIGGVLFGFFAGYSYWFPKIMGFKLNERLGKYAFWFWFVGIIIAFIPLYTLGLMGATRRMDHYDSSTGWHPMFVCVACGVFLVIIGIIFQNIQLLYSIIHRKENWDTTGDPWDGRTLEWSTASPPPFYNFAHTPTVRARDDFWETKYHPMANPHLTIYDHIHLPQNSPAGGAIGLLSLIFGFAIIWHIWWLTIASFAGIVITAIVRLSSNETEFYLPPDEVKEIETHKIKRDMYDWAR
jgi:cytochrome o ubiquinol oxidase subunit 1